MLISTPGGTSAFGSGGLSSDYIKLGASPWASTGHIRGTNLLSCFFRNAADNADLCVFQVGGTNILNIGQDSADGSQVAGIEMYTSAGGNIFVGNGATTQLAISSSGVTLWQAGPLIFGSADAAGIGQIRLKYAATDTIIAAKHSGGTDTAILSRPSADAIRLGQEDRFNGSVYFSALDLWGKSSVNIYAGAAGSATVVSSNGTSTGLGLPVAGHAASSAPFRFEQTDITKNDALDVTLTAAQYANPVIRVTGTPGGAFNVITPNTAKGFFIVDNATASAATIKRSGGTGVVVAANRKAFMYDNGTDIVRLTADST